jgi:hypothetical protein
MAFIRKKNNRSGTTTYHVVRSVREGKRVKQIVLTSLAECETIAARLDELKAHQDQFRAMTALVGPSRNPKLELAVEQEIRLLKRLQQEYGLP